MNFVIPEEERPNYYETLGELREGYRNCTTCPELCKERLTTPRKHREYPGYVVMGDGPDKADIMIVGEAPGANEDAEGKPFIGEAGAMLSDLLLSAGLDRERVYVTNCICCRPEDNRDPTDPEMNNCYFRLLNEIYLVDPVVIVAAGGKSIKNILRSRVDSVIRENGVVRSILLAGRTRYIPRMVMPISHPAFLYRNPGLRRMGFVHRDHSQLAVIHEVVETLHRVRAGGEP